MRAGRPCCTSRASGTSTRSARACRGPDYVLLPVLDGLGAAYGAADLALMRAASTVWELAAAGLPAVLVPYPFATADHQTKNARYFERGGGAIVIPESELGRAPETVRSLLDDPAAARADERGNAERRAAGRGRARSQRS